MPVYYDEILCMEDVPQDIWFISSVGKIKTLGKMGNRKDMNEALERTRRSVTNKMALAYLVQIEADILGIEGEVESAKQLFERCIGTFRHFHHPLFLSIAYNNYAIVMFNDEKYKDAEKLWKQAKRSALEAGSKYQEAIVLTNLASIMRQQNRFTTARKYLERAQKTHSSMNNLEKLSDVEFNFSLLYMEEGDLESSKAMFNRSMFTTFPFLSEAQRKERLNVLTREAEKLKYTPIKNGQNYSFVYND
jgi:tetratricopeptide (TPR) repeat protein